MADQSIGSKDREIHSLSYRSKEKGVVRTYRDLNAYKLS